MTVNIKLRSGITLIKDIFITKLQIISMEKEAIQSTPRQENGIKIN